jgi:hypothetical protein
MAAIVTDQFRILNASNFIDSVENPLNSYYVFLGLPNPSTKVQSESVVGFGRSTTWNIDPPNPIDNHKYRSHFLDTSLFGKRVTSSNIRRVIRKINWVKGNRYEMYRHDYSLESPSPITNSSRLYDTNYYVVNSDYRVYICTDNGSSGENPLGNLSQDEPIFTDLEPAKSGETDGYIWKYLFTVSPSDIIKFDSTEYISVPNDWESSINSQIQAVRENGNSEVNNNQIKKIYIEDGGSEYQKNLSGYEVDILGDGSGGRVQIDTDSDGKIISANVSSGGKGYTYALVDLGSINSNSLGNSAKLVPIIPPSKGHGYDIYTELGTDRVLVYARFDDSTKDFPIDTKFAQVGIIKNPTSIGSTNIYTDSNYSSLYAIKFSEPLDSTPIIGEIITQSVTGDGSAYGYVASYDSETYVLKYFQDRSLYYSTTNDETDYVGISSRGSVLPFESSSEPVFGSSSGFSGSIDTAFSGISTVIASGNKVVNLSTIFQDGLSSPEINKTSGDLIYIDNRTSISRNSRQKEDIKIILEF